MSGSNSPDYKALFLKAEEERKQAEQRQRQEAKLRREAEERQRQAEDREGQERERNRPTTFGEFIKHCHDHLWRPLRAEAPSRSTTGTIPPPTGKYCPIRLRPWSDCAARQREIYTSVCRYLQPTEEGASQLFAPLVELEGLGRRFALRPISSEQDLESYERFAVEDHVRDIISELCKIPAAREEFGLGDGVWFDNHANALDDIERAGSDTRLSRPDQFCIHRVDGESNALLTTVEYKPPHKLSVETIRAGFRQMDFWQEVVNPDAIPTDGPEKLRYNAARLAGSAGVQQFHVMIQQGLGGSYITNGLIDVQLWVPFDDPTTLYYDVGEPDIDLNTDFRNIRGPRTRVERALCSCLMSFRTPLRDQAWRNAAQAKLPIWHTSFDSVRSQIPAAELLQNTSLGYASSEYTSPEQTTSEYLPSSSPVGSHVTKGRRVATRSASGCAPSSDQQPREDSSDSEVDPAASAGRKRGFSQITSSPPAQRSAPGTDPQRNQGGQSRPHAAQFCTQRCLMGLQQGGALDPRCPNVEVHSSSHNDRHPINAEDLVKMVKAQLDEDLDHNCTPIGSCGSYGAPFKVTCAAYGYTIIGKGTTSRLWKEVSREAEIYRVLQRAQGSAVPVFLGAIDLANIYFLHGAGEIRHMLLMGWGGESVGSIHPEESCLRAISRSVREIHSLGVLHQDLRPENILWNSELKRALIIDFHRCILDHRPIHKRPGSLKRLRCAHKERESKRVRAV
ncbi:hypothetical protein ASPSYDRAFT_165259 [Aspergillus sydowii CBS 593.65]|uniref:Protein kinase domain-containing protein n=1 Tax=Aspergillus sydowii CBS 593.65 TaxID=1036612 RepID=A0A1L9SY37_9EURO|nr:uncharacterized protein ASPSYDRAFT_165259 [Aspergillus sydowii CBS 593.65]OJJ52047.1 hypothetical protein ASPSYDRAFT_165259 [Aspergillus sydowii CBS 593.65]